MQVGGARKRTGIPVMAGGGDEGLKRSWGHYFFLVSFENGTGSRSLANGVRWKTQISMAYYVGWLEENEEAREEEMNWREGGRNKIKQHFVHERGG